MNFFWDTERLFRLWDADGSRIPCRDELLERDRPETSCDEYGQRDERCRVKHGGMAFKVRQPAAVNAGRLMMWIPDLNASQDF